jgi:hypothetical protein
MQSRFMINLLGIILLSTTAIMAADGPKLEKKELPVEVQVKVLKAVHTRDEIEQQKAALVAKFNELNQQIQDLKSQYLALDQPGKDAQKAVDDATIEAAQRVGIDNSKYTLNLKTLTFDPKPPTSPTATPPAPAPVPEKK